MNQPDRDWTERIKTLKAPTLLVFADADSIRPEHMIEFWKLLGGGQRDAGFDGSLRPANQLAIIPNTTHYNLIQSPLLTRGRDGLPHAVELSSRATVVSRERTSFVGRSRRLHPSR